ncbi:MAG: ABC-ATPase domain-containing protein [Firmicutes bacterium]|nr:ABC-ATPase domain-containing protein [Bacillota bacterium]
MVRIENLSDTLRRIEGRGYKAYQDIRGEYAYRDANLEFILIVDHVQADPFAPPSRIRVQVPQRVAGFPQRYLESKIRRVALSDFLTRSFALAARARTKTSGPGAGPWASSSHEAEVGVPIGGTGRSGQVSIARSGQEILERNSVLIDENMVEVRFTVGLPAAGRRILGRAAQAIFLELLPRIVAGALIYKALPAESLDRHVKTAEDAEALRGMLGEKGLVAFVGNGAILPRRSGVDDRPLPAERAIPFSSPPSLEVEFDLPNRGRTRGMGIPEGVTLIVGGGYHGKSTLLRAIERGVYNHIPGDGRELVVTSPLAMKIRAEDGRAVTRTDISPFIKGLPLGGDTRSFSTENASGSTSQAANIMEALEAGAKVLLVDEDTSATNFMIRDRRMQALVAKAKEPITPFIDRIESLKESGVSTILVLGGSGDYFDVADTVIMMDEYRPVDVTRRAKDIARELQTGRINEAGEDRPFPRPRVPASLGLGDMEGRRSKVKAMGTDAIRLGHEEIDLSFVEQVVDDGQTRFIADALRYLGRKLVNGRSTIPELISRLWAVLEREGLDAVAPYVRGDYCMARPLEVAAALNRLRTLQIK